MHLNLNKNRKNHHNSLNNFQLQRFTKKLYAFRCTGKQQHLNSAKTQIQAPNTLIASVLQEFSVNTQGSDAQWEGKAAECKPAPESLPERVSPKGTTKRHMHLNLNKNRKKHHNSLNNFQLHEHPKHLSAFRCSEKQEHLNSAKMRIQAPNTLTASALQEFQQQYPRFRCSGEMKHARMQTRPAGTSGKGPTERHCKPPDASEPEP